MFWIHRTVALAFGGLRIGLGLDPGGVTVGSPAGLKRRSELVALRLGGVAPFVQDVIRLLAQLAAATLDVIAPLISPLAQVAPQLFAGSRSVENADRGANAEAQQEIGEF